MKIIVKDAQEAIEVADILRNAAGSIWCDMDLNKNEQQTMSDLLWSMRESIEVEKRGKKCC